MSPDDRRAQLLDVGARMFAERPYEDVAMEDVAARAGVSRALVYRYFPAKRDFFAAIFRRASERLMEVTRLDPALSLAEQVVVGLDNHIDYFVENARTALVANRGPLSGDPVVQTIISDELAELRRRMLDACGLEGAARARASVALHGWLAFVRVVCVEWLVDRSAMSREQLRELCLGALSGALGRELGER